jgi:hypothetical protein
MFRDIGDIVEARAAATTAPAAAATVVDPAPARGDGAPGASGSGGGGGAGAGAGGEPEDDGMLHDYGTDEEDDGADLEQGEPEAFVMNQVRGGAGGGGGQRFWNLERGDTGELQHGLRAPQLTDNAQWWPGRSPC